MCVFPSRGAEEISGGILFSQNIELDATTPDKISSGRLIWIPAQKCQTYINMSTREMLLSQGEFRKSFGSIADNQIQFACSLLQYFLKDTNGSSVFMQYMLDAVDLIEDFMPEWKKKGWKRKISSYAIFPAMLRLTRDI